MLSARQNEIVTGSLLGDGMVWTNHQPGGVDRFCLNQSKLDNDGEDKRSYMLWYVSEFLDLGCSIRPRTVEVNGLVSGVYDQYVFTTRCDSLWNDIERKWYIPIVHPYYKRKKIVPPDIRLTPLAFCVWYMEDGSNYSKDANITLETQCFTEEEVEMLIEKLQSDLGIEASKKRTKRQDQFRIYIGRESYFEAIEIAKSQVQWDCFKYKVDITAYNKQPHRGETHSLAKLTEYTAKRAFELREKGMLQKDIAQELGVSKATISLLLSGDRWNHLEKSTGVKRKPRVSKDTISRIYEMSQQGMTNTSIGKCLDISQPTVSRILKKRRHAES